MDVKVTGRSIPIRIVGVAREQGVRSFCQLMGAIREVEVYTRQKLMEWSHMHGRAKGVTKRGEVQRSCDQKVTG